MNDLRRSQRYFIEGKGEADEKTSNNIDIGRDELMVAVENFPESIEKTETEKELLEWVMDNVAQIAQLYGAKPYPYKAEHFHIISDEAWNHKIPEIGSSAVMLASRTGIYASESQIRNNNLLDNTIAIAHECFHLNGLNKIVYRDKIDELEAAITHRSGVTITHGKKDKSLRYRRFDGLNEGMTQELAKIFYAKVIRNSEKFKNQIEEFDSKNPAEDENHFLYPKGVIQSYGWLTALFEDLCEKIKGREPKKFKDFNEVRDNFFQIYFTGEIKDLKTLLDIIGQGSFGDLSEIGPLYTATELEKISLFRKKYGLAADPGIESLIKMPVTNK